MCVSDVVAQLIAADIIRVPARAVHLKNPHFTFIYFLNNIIITQSSIFIFHTIFYNSMIELFMMTHETHPTSST